MTARSGRFRAWCVQAWRCVLQTTQAMAGLDPTGQFNGWRPPPYPVVPVGRAHFAMIATPDGWWAVVPVGWAHCTQWADEPPAVLTEVTQQAVPERRGVFTPTEWARLRVLRDQYQANRPPFTPRELAHLHFVRWLHQTGRLNSSSW